MDQVEAKNKAIEILKKAIHEATELVINNTGLGRQNAVECFIIPNILDDFLPETSRSGIIQYFFNTSQMNDYHALVESAR